LKKVKELLKKVEELLKKVEEVLKKVGAHSKKVKERSGKVGVHSGKVGALSGKAGAAFKKAGAGAGKAGARLERAGVFLKGFGDGEKSRGRRPRGPDGRGFPEYGIRRRPAGAAGKTGELYPAIPVGGGGGRGTRHRRESGRSVLSAALSGSWYYYQGACPVLSRCFTIQPGIRDLTTGHGD
jgi:hypothetical protein